MGDIYLKSKKQSRQVVTDLWFSDCAVQSVWAGIIGMVRVGQIRVSKYNFRTFGRQLYTPRILDNVTVFDQALRIWLYFESHR